MMSTFAITGATGHLGRKVIQSLRALVPSEQIVAIVRDPAKAVDLGVPVRAADYNHLADLKNALTGIDTLLLISSSSLNTRKTEHQNVIEAAKDAGVRRIVYTSLLHAEQWEISFAEDHLVTEQWIKVSGLDFTILRNGWYWENHTANLSQLLEHGYMLGSVGDAKISWASRQDYADAAVAVLTQSHHSEKIYELAGDQAYTLSELADETSRQSGVVFGYRHLCETDYAAFLETMGLPPAVAAIVSEIDSRGVAKGVLAENDDTLSTLIARPTTTLQTAVGQALEP